MLSWLRRSLIDWAVRGELRSHEMKESAVAQVLVSGAGGAQWSGERYDVIAKEAYIHNVVAYRCITEIARAVASVPWGVYKEDKEGNKTKLPTHELNKVLRRANPYESFSYLMLRSAAFLALDGNVFIEGVTTSLNLKAKMGVPAELYSHQPNRMEIVANSNGLLEKYVYIGPSGRKIEWPVDPITQKSSICHIKLFHPLNDWWGLSPTRPTSRDIDTSNEMANWNMRLIQNNARPGMIFTSESFVDDIQFKKFKEQLYQKFSGSENAGRSLLLDGGKWKVEKAQLTPQELDFTEGQRELARRIALGYGVPPMLLGIPGDNTYSNYQEARFAFWEDTIFFYLELFKGDLNNWLPGEDETLIIDYILDDVAALEPRRAVLWERAQKSDFLTINEKRQMVGRDEYKPSEQPGDEILVSATMIPLGEDMDETEEEARQEEEQEEEERPKEDEEE